MDEFWRRARSLAGLLLVLAPCASALASWTLPDFAHPPEPDLNPWYIARGLQLALLAVLMIATLGAELWRNPTARTWSGFLERARTMGMVGAFAVVCLWAVEVRARRDARGSWQRPLHVAVTLIAREPLDPKVSQAFARRAQGAMAFLYEERRRYDPRANPPVWLHVFGPTDVSVDPPSMPQDRSLISRARYRYALGRYFADVDHRAHVSAGCYDVRIYVLARNPKPGVGVRFVEGIGEAWGELGMVEVDLDQSMVDAGWTAVLHELMHTVGARDKYDGQGHAALPQGIADPQLVPPFPQRAAEIMVGEVPLSRSSGRLARGLDEVRVGAVTAREIGWK